MSGVGGNGRGPSVYVGAVATEVPAFHAEQAAAGETILRLAGGSLRPRSVSLTRKLHGHPSIRNRHFAIETPESLFAEDPDGRVDRFTRRSIQLSAGAILSALASAGISADRIGALVVNTCTGYICPGISTYLVETLDLPRDTRVYDLVGAGCGGAIPNLELAASLAGEVGDRVVASVSVEICSATMQVGDELSLLVSNALFGDGAAAALLQTRPEGLEIVDTASWYVPEERESIRYVHRNGQLHNQLSTSLPGIVAQAAGIVVRRLLEPHSLTVGNVPHWAIHPGGDKIVRTVGEELGLTASQLAPTRRVLAAYGNMSSPTVWFVLKEALAEDARPGTWYVMLAFGAGLCAHACLLRRS